MLSRFFPMPETTPKANCPGCGRHWLNDENCVCDTIIEQGRKLNKGMSLEKCRELQKELE